MANLCKKENEEEEKPMTAILGALGYTAPPPR